MRRRLLILCIAVAIVVRAVAALALTVGPWTDEPEELAGWDVERFWEIAEAPGRHWVDEPVEYPPGSVMVFEAVADGDLVGTHRRLVVLSFLVDLTIAGLAAAIGGVRSLATYLVLGLPLVPMGLLRLDLWAAGLALMALLALGRRRPAAFACLVTAAALVKVWPALLVAPAIALGRRAAVLGTATTAVLSTLAWIAYGGWRLEPIDQVLSLRGASGWHVESVPGSLVALLTDEEPTLQLNAFRIGEIDTTIVRLGQLLALAVAAALAALVGRAARPADRGEATVASPVPTPAEVAPPMAAGVDGGGNRVGRCSVGGRPVVGLVALAMLGSTATLVVTAPLLSPQFLLWLTPWAAVAAGLVPRHRAPVVATGVAATLTGLVLVAYGPAGVADTVPALLLLARDGALVAVPITVATALWRLGSGRTEDPLGHGGPTPRPAGANA
ncbi:MAG: hypothetical protein ACFCVK_12280 [Acidimicrobiales bacterium]